MIKSLIHKVSYHHHPWRKLKFDELAEIYTSMSLRSLAFSLIGIFVPIFLYLEGVSVAGVLFFYVIFFAVRPILAFPTGMLIGRIGPKHTIAVSTVILVLFLFMLLSYPTMGWPLALLATVFTTANGLFFLALHTDFSKIQHNEHGGKELGWLTIFERLGSAIGPFVGGVVASFIAPEATIVLAILVLIASLIPLFMTKEPIKTHQKVSYRGLNHKKYARNNFALAIFNIVISSNGIIWPLYVGVFVFTDNAYAKLGVLVAISMAVSMFSARMFGKFIDGRKGRALLNYGSVMNFVLYVSRAFVTTPGGAIAATTLSEPLILSYKMPMVKAFYDEADSVESQRISYLVWSEAWMSVAKCLYFLVLLLFVANFDSSMTIRVSFVIAGLLSFLMMTQKYSALKKV